MVEIAVIGAGAAGLVSARNLIRCGMRPSIFESSSKGTVGGAWNPSGLANKMWDNLTPNLSKYTCVFSDFLWGDEETPTFPTRLDMKNYLENYATTFVDPDCFQYGCTVTSVKRTNQQSDLSGLRSVGAFQQQFQVEWADHDGQSFSKFFDGVIVGTGFFANPVLPEGLVAHLQNDVVIHSAQYRNPSDFCNQTVAVCGSSFSALEIAADVRKQAKKVISIVPRVPWVLPRYVQAPETAESRGGFAPLDCVLYQRTQDAPQIPATIEMDSEACRKKHTFLRSLAGPRKQQESPLGIPEDDSSPPLVAISDDYLNLVIEGNIDVIKGRLAKITNADGGGPVAIELENGEVLEGIDRIIACTGYESQLSFLEADILKLLEYDQKDTYAPLTLCYDTFHPQVPGLGFVGMYKGPYFGVMELQARLLAGMYSGEVSLSDETISEALKECQTIRNPRTIQVQFPRHDYIGFMDSIAQHLDLVPSNEYGAKGTMASPPFFQPSEDIASRCKKDLEHEMYQQEGSEQEGSANMAKVALSALIGKWDFYRTITQFNHDITQTVTGTIAFSHMLPPTKDAGGEQQTAKQEWNTVLYDENGIFHMGDKDMEVFRKYEYQYKDNGILEIYFVEYGKRAHLFLSLKFTEKEDGYWVATSDHLCIKDLYSAHFKIAFDGIGAKEVTMTYRVRGPQKDYESVTHLRPRRP